MIKKVIISTPIALFILTIIFHVAYAASDKYAMANPASVNCIKKGGSLSIQKRGDAGEYGICIFEGNHQCEEWAMFRGECPAGGVKVTGYATPAARICVITGGTYTATDNNNMDNEQGNCAFKDGSVCDVWDYYNGKCIRKDKTSK